MPSLPISPMPSNGFGKSTRSRGILHKLSKAVMKSRRVRIPKYDIPIRIRLWFIIFTILIWILLLFLGFTNFSRALPFPDKTLHFFWFCLGTAVFYFILDVAEEARRIWFWRHCNMIATLVIYFFFGGIISELIQAILPFKTLEIGDIIANLLGATLGLAIGYYLERYYRHRREIDRLYRPLDTDSYSDSEDEAEIMLNGAQLLPTFRPPNNPSKPAPKSATRLTDVWDEREELFGIGVDSDEEEDQQVSGDGAANGGLLPPRIYVTSA